MEINRDNIYAAYINLKERPERNERMIQELERVGLQAERFEAYPWKELWDNATELQRYKWGWMKNVQKTPGSIGCFESQLGVMKKAIEQDKHAFVMEDDLVFCDDLQERLDIIFEFLNREENNQWDVFWMGGTYHIEPEWHKLDNNNKHTHQSLKMCTCSLNKDWEPTNNPKINRTYGAFSTHAYIVNKDKINNHVEFLNKGMHLSMGIDWSYILEQPKLQCYAFNPGCIRQYSSQSNIGHGVSDQEGFQKLGRHVFSRFMDKYQWE